MAEAVALEIGADPETGPSPDTSADRLDPPADPDVSVGSAAVSVGATASFAFGRSPVAVEPDPPGQPGGRGPKGTRQSGAGL